MFSDSLQQNAADGDHVCGEESEQDQGDDDVEGGGGAEIDEADDAGADGGEVDGVVGDVALVVHLRVLHQFTGPFPTLSAVVEITRDIHLEKGNPWSREKAQVSREVVASAVTLPENTSKKSMTVSVVATPREPVLLKRFRYGAGESMASLRSPMQKSIVMSMVMPIVTLRR